MNCIVCGAPATQSRTGTDGWGISKLTQREAYCNDCVTIKDDDDKQKSGRFIWGTTAVVCGIIVLFVICSVAAG